MPAHPPAPGWTRRIKIHGWPHKHMSTFLKDTFSAKVAHDFWQKIARRVIYDLIHTGTANLYPLGTLDKIPNTRTVYRNPRTGLPAARTHIWHIRFRQSKRLRALIGAGSVPQAEQTPSTIRRAIADAQISPVVGAEIWHSFSSRITTELRSGRSINFSGFGTFIVGFSARHRYRDLHTHLLRTATAKHIALFRPSKLMKGWIEAGAIPPDV